MNPKDILDFWFAEENKRAWFQSTPEFDEAISEHFEKTWKLADAGGHDDWRETPDGTLALVILFDQFPLNMYRNEAVSFSTEAKARAVSAIAIEAGWDKDFNDEERLFLYLPWMHSETLADQDHCIQLFSDAGMDLRYPHHHRDIVARFGRFPHRNAVLGRDSTPEELEWLASDEAFTG